MGFVKQVYDKILANCSETQSYMRKTTIIAQLHLMSTEIKSGVTSFLCCLRKIIKYENWETSIQPNGVNIFS